jgi:hypothetical protein
MKPACERRAWTSDVRRELDVVRQLLRSPNVETYDRCRPRLEHAIGCLEQFEQTIRTSPISDQQHARRELERIRRDVDQVAALMESAAAFYQGLGQILAAATSGYTRTGESGRWTAGTRLAMEG